MLKNSKLSCGCKFIKNLTEKSSVPLNQGLQRDFHKKESLLQIQSKNLMKTNSGSMKNNIRGQEQARGHDSNQLSSQQNNLISLNSYQNIVPNMSNIKGLVYNQPNISQVNPYQLYQNQNINAMLGRLNYNMIQTPYINPNIQNQYISQQPNIIQNQIPNYFVQGVQNVIPAPLQTQYYYPPQMQLVQANPAMVQNTQQMQPVQIPVQTQYQQIPQNYFPNYNNIPVSNLYQSTSFQKSYQV